MSRGAVVAYRCGAKPLGPGRVVLVALLLMAGCGGGEERAAQAPPPDQLLVTVRPKGPDGTVMRRTVRCGSDPGCDLPPSRFEPVAPERACTQIFAGPATATVKGTLRGEPVDAQFSLANGCEIARWEAASALLGDPPGRRGPPSLPSP